AGIPIRLDLSWFVIFFVYTWVISKIYLPSMIPGMSQTAYWPLGIGTVLLLFISILAHELAHSLVARREGIGISGISLYIFGGLSHLEREPETPLSEFKIAAAGPAASLLLAILFYSLAGISKAFLHLGAVNLLLACFNLLPGFPLDGG